MTKSSAHVETIFLNALEISSTDVRQAYVAAECRDNDQMRSEVQDLLRRAARLGDFLESDTALLVELPDSDARSIAKIGSRIGPYTLREQIGEGGMGVVYAAEQSEPVRRKVALKIIKPGMATKSVVSRFEAERQALAMMDHPNVATVHDGGTTEDGHPFFVMELVQGLPITEYCDQHRLGLRERLELFQQVCGAVEHAHRKGIIHRDLKPSNMLVPEIDGRAVPKVIDFGIAKALGEKLSDATVYTQLSQLVGTPAYMSPEQAGMGVIDVDTRSDVYSLGVLLYELLTGRTPLDTDTLKQVGFDEMRRMIREDDPPHPSDRVSTLNAQVLSTVAEQRASSARNLSSTLRGELNWIVMTALEKDRERRYESASVLAEEVERYVCNEPIIARPTSRWYRVKKFARRNRALVASSAAVLITLAVGLALSTTAFLHAVKTLAEKESVLQDNSVFISLLSEMYPRPFLRANPGKTRTIYEFIEETTRDINDNGRLNGHPLVEIEVRRIFAAAYFSAHEYDKFRDHLHKALVMAKQEHGEDSLIVAEIHKALAYEFAHHKTMTPKTVLEHADEAIRIYGLYDKEEESVHAWVAKTHALMALDRLEEAKIAGEKAIALDGEHPVYTYVDMGFVLMTMGELDSALDCFNTAIKNHEIHELRGSARPAIEANLLGHKAKCLRRRYELAEAQKTYSEAYNLLQTPELLTEPGSHGIGLSLADVNFALGDVNRAFALVDQIEGICRDNDVTSSLILCLDSKGWFYFQLGDYEAAAEAFADATKLASEREMVDDPKMDSRFGRPCARLALTYQELGKQELAARAYKELRPFTQYFVDDLRVLDYPYWVHAHGILAENDTDQLDEANKIYVAAFEKVRNSTDYYPEARKAAYYVLNAMIQRKQNPENLDSVIAKLTDDLGKVTEPRATYANERDNMVPTDRWQGEAKLVDLLLEDQRKDRKDEAFQVMLDALQVRRDAFDDAHIQTLLAQIRLAEFVIREEAYEFGRETYDEAAELEGAYEHLPKTRHLDGVRRQVAELLVDAYLRKSDAAKADHWRKTLEGLSQGAHDAASSRDPKQETYETKAGS